MAFLHIPSRRVWTRQPPGPVGVDWSNPLARDLSAMVVGSQVHRELVNNAPLQKLFGTTGAYDVLAGRNAARGWKVTASTSSGRVGFDFGYQGPNAVDRVSICVGWADVLPAGTVYGAGPAVDAFSVRSSVGFHYSAGTTYWGGNFRDLGGNVRFLTGTSAVAAKVPAVVVLRESSTTGKHQLWVNGRLEAETSAYTFQGGAKLRYYDFGTTAGVIVNALTGYWTRDLSESEIVAVSRNPWSLFAPQSSPIFYSLPSTIGGIPVLSLPLLHFLNANSAVPKVTVTFN